MITISSILVLLMCSLCFGASQYADCNKLSVISGCLCPGRSIVYECAVADSTSQGLTVWEVPRIMNSLCSTEISLSHTAMNFGDQTGGCVEALGKGVSVNGGCYLSQLSINVSTIIFAEGGGIEGNVTCSFDNGTVIIVESKRLSVPTAGNLSITNLSLTNSQPGWLKLSWDLVKVLDCPSINYMINATDGCGVCPSNVSINAATCREVRGGSNCTVSIYADICHDRIWSESLSLITASLDVSITSLRLSESQLGGLTFSWDQVTVNISDCPSIFYMINATNGCGVCPQNVSTNFATCREVKGENSCTFTVYADICYDRTSTATVTVNTNLVSPSVGNVRVIAGTVTSGLVIILLIIVFGIIIVFGVRVYKRQHLNQQIGIERHGLDLELEDNLNHEQHPQAQLEHPPVAIDEQQPLLDEHVHQPAVAIDEQQPLLDERVHQPAVAIDEQQPPLDEHVQPPPVDEQQPTTHDQAELPPPQSEQALPQPEVEVPPSQPEQQLVNEHVHQPAVAIDEQQPPLDEHVQQPPVDEQQPTTHDQAELPPPQSELALPPPEVEVPPSQPEQQLVNEHNIVTMHGEQRDVLAQPGPIPVREQVNMFSRYNYQRDNLDPLGVGAHKAVLGEPTTIDLMLNADKDEKSISCELHFHSDVTKCTVKRTDACQYKISYMSKKRGVHSLHIKVDGRHYQKSPYKIVVSPSVKTRGKPVKVIKGLMQPTGVALSKQGHVIVVEESNKCVTIYDPSGDDLHKRLSFGPPMRKDEIGLVKPCGVAVINDRILVSDCERHCISEFTFSGNHVQSIGHKGSGEHEFNEPMGIGVHPETHEIYVADFGNCRIQVLDIDLNFRTQFGSFGSGDGQLNKPWGVAFDSYGDVYIADGGNDRIQVFTKIGDFKTKFGRGGHDQKQLSWPSSLAIDRMNHLVYVTEDDNNRISVFTLTGEYVTSFGKWGTEEGEFKLPHGIVIDEDGLDIFVADHHNNRLQIF